MEQEEGSVLAAERLPVRDQAVPVKAVCLLSQVGSPLQPDGDARLLNYHIRINSFIYRSCSMRCEASSDLRCG